jgi:hypothetical protein
LMSLNGLREQGSGDLQLENSFVEIVTSDPRKSWLEKA